MGHGRVTGHSLWVAGAQALTALGLELYAVQLLGRWGSSAVARYVRDSTVSAAAMRARSLALPRDLRSAARAGHEAFEGRSADASPARVRQWFDEWIRADQPRAAKALTQDAIAELRRRWERARERRLTQHRESDNESFSSSTTTDSGEQSEATRPRPRPTGTNQRRYETARGRSRIGS